MSDVDNGLGHEMSDVDNVEHGAKLFPTPKHSQRLVKIIRLSLTHIWNEEGVHIGWAEVNRYKDLCQHHLGCAPTNSSAYRHLAQEKARYEAGIAAAEKPRKPQNKKKAADEEQEYGVGDEWADDGDDGGGASRKRRKVSKTSAEEDEEEEGDEAEGGESEGEIDGDFDGESEGDEGEDEGASGDEDGGGEGEGEGLQEELDALLDEAELDEVPKTGITRPVLQVGQRVKIRESSVGWANENIPGSCVEHTTGTSVRPNHGIIRGENRRSWRVQFFSTHVPARLFDVRTDRLYGLFPDEWELATEQRFAAIRE